ncbi:alpha/beta hydrolase [Candidatus Daviesbacteria bacterium]|nr:alpha/beta hydrolase [Candidatus Daviesbacteria bacterium]
MSGSYRKVEGIFYPQDSIRCFYWIEGEKNNPPMLFLPGYTGTYAEVEGFTKLLTGDFLVITPDLPGWGKSDAPKEDLNLQYYGRYLGKLLDHLNIEKINVVGHCMGAAVAFEFAYQFPNRINNLILVSTPYLNNTIRGKIFSLLAQASSNVPPIIRPIFFFWRNRLFQSVMDIFSLKFKTKKQKLNFILKTIKTQHLQNEKAVEDAWNSMVCYDYSKAKQIKKRVHLIHGDEDLLVSKNQAQRFRSLWGDTTLDFIPGSGHIPPLESPQSLAEIIKKYLGNEKNP